MRASLGAALAGTLVFSAAPPSLANGRFPASNQLAFSPVDPNLVVLRTTFGVLISHDHGTSWGWLCEDVLGILSSAPEDPVLALTANGNLIAAPPSPDGVYVSPDTGCSWTRPSGPLTNQLAKDLAVRPDAPDVVVALSSTFGSQSGPDGGRGYAQQVYQSTDDGITWAALGAPIDPGALTTTIEVGPTASHRIYISATRLTQSTASLFVSSDDGATWTERPVPIDPSMESAIYIGAVDPQSVDRVYIRTAGATSRLLVTDDAGLTFHLALTLSGQMLGFALSPDGSKVYAGDFVQGLFFGTRDSQALQNVSPVHVQCLATHGPELWVCSDEPSGFIAGASSDDGADFVAKAHLTLQPLIACPPASAAATTCGGTPWQAFCQQLPPGCVDGGIVGAGAGADAGAGGDAGRSGAGSPSSKSGGGCSFSEPRTWQGDALGAAGASALLAGLGARRRLRAAKVRTLERSGRPQSERSEGAGAARERADRNKEARRRASGR